MPIYGVFKCHKTVSFVGMKHEFVKMYGERVYNRNSMGIQEGRPRPGVPWEANILPVDAIILARVLGSLSTKRLHI